MWLVPVKINGNSPIELLNRINTNSTKKNSVLPWIGRAPRRILISECRIDFTLFRIRELVLGLNQNEPGIKIRGINNLYQFGNRMIDEDGSKLEKRFVIIITEMGFVCWGVGLG